MPAVVGAGGASTIVQPVGAQTKPTITQRPLVNLRRFFFTAADLQNPERLYQVIYQQQQAIDAAIRTISSDPTLGGNLIKGNVFTTGQTLYINHGLGRAFQGVLCTKAVGLPWLYVIAAQPVGVGPDKVIPLTSTNAGTYDLKVF